MNFHLLSCVQKQWRVGFLTFFILLVITIPAYQGITLKQYDLVIANGNSLMFFRSSTNESTNIPLMERDKNLRIVSVVSDPQNDLVYFSIVRKDTSSIAFYNLVENRTTEIFSSSKGSIGSLTFHQDYLYWCNEFNKTVLRLEVPSNGMENQTILSSPEVVFMDKNASFDSMAMNPLDGKFFYTKWSRGNESQILLYDQATKSAKIFVENVYQPQGLSASPTHLYWIDNTPGIYFNIERISFSEPAKRELIYRGLNQHPFVISTFDCPRKMFWSDVMNKVLWEFDLKEKTPKLLHYYKDSAPYGITLAKQPSICNEEEMDTSPVKVMNLPKKTAETKEDCKGVECKKIDAYTNLPADTSYVQPNGSVSDKTAKVVEVDGISAHWCTSSEKTNCVNGASCLNLDGQIKCLCQPGFAGSTCAQTIGTDRQVSGSYLSLSSWSSNPPFFLSCIVFSTVVTLLLVAILVLALKVRRLDQKPRIRRRLVVSHRSDADNNSSGSSVCEMIDIENCCNMNVCETPCYERVTGPGSNNVPGIKGRIRKSSVKEDKKCLLSS